MRAGMLQYVLMHYGWGRFVMAKWLWYFAFGLTWLGLTCAPGNQKTITREGTNAGMAHALETP
jgi:hypothetical protein